MMIDRQLLRRFISERGSAQAAREIGVSRPTLWRWETGVTSRPHPAYVDRLQRALFHMQHAEDGRKRE